jgi:hypothetical protein
MTIKTVSVWASFALTIKEEALCWLENLQEEKVSLSISVCGRVWLGLGLGFNSCRIVY